MTNARNVGNWDAIGDAQKNVRNVHNKHDVQESLRHEYAKALKDFGIGEPGQKHLTGEAASKWSAYLKQFSMEISNDPKLKHILGEGFEIVHSGDTKHGSKKSPMEILGADTKGKAKILKDVSAEENPEIT